MRPARSIQHPFKDTTFGLIRHKSNSVKPVNVLFRGKSHQSKSITDKALGGPLANVGWVPISFHFNWINVIFRPMNVFN